MPLRTIRRTRLLAGLTAVLAVALTAVGTSPALAQGGPVGGSGSQYLVAGAGRVSGAAAVQFRFGGAADEVHVGDFVTAAGTQGGDGRDDVMVRRGNTFTIRGATGPAVVYGDPGDTVLVGDWDGDGDDTLAVRRGNTFFVRNTLTSGPADVVFGYGDAGDTVLVGNWDGDTSAAGADRPLTTDTLAVRRGHHYLVRNSLTTGPADSDFYFGDPGDDVLVGDWVGPPPPGRRGVSGDHADALAVRRGNLYLFSEEVWTAALRGPGAHLRTGSSTVFGLASDTAFTMQMEATPVGSPGPVYGDGIGLRRGPW